MAERDVTAKHVMEEAHRLGFDLASIVYPHRPSTFDCFRTWLEHGFHGEMTYLARPDATAKRADLSLLQPGLRSAVVVGVNYYTGTLPTHLGDDPSRGIVASYAWGSQYHDWVRSRLHQLAAFIRDSGHTAVAYRAYVDTGPILERELAARAGLGFVGKNTNLIHPRFGSRLLLGELLLDIELLETQQEPRQGTCGNCTRCLNACPTDALIAPYILDARRCISYLTIELKGIIPRELRPLMGNRIFGCDICQDVCPWNRRFSQPTRQPAFQPRSEAQAPPLLDLLALDADGFRIRFGDSPIQRTKRRGLLRNAAVALGNWGDRSAIKPLVRALHDEEPLIRGHASWALGQIGGNLAQTMLAQALSAEADPWVREEIAQVLEPG